MLVHPEGYLRGGPRALRPLRRAADPRRGGHRLRAQRADVRLRARGRGAGPALPGQGDHAAATCRWRRRSPAERVYEGFLGEFEEFRTFFHGHTYTGNPLACAAAIASLDVFSRGAHARGAGAQDRATGLAARAAGRPSRRAGGAARRLHGRDRAGGVPAPRPHGPPRDAGGTPPGRDHPAAGRRGRADAPAGDLGRRPARLVSITAAAIDSATSGGLHLEAAA